MYLVVQVHLLRKTEGKRYGYTTIHGLWLLVCLDGQELGRSSIGKLVTKRSWEVTGHRSLSPRVSIRHPLIVGGAL